MDLSNGYLGAVFDHEPQPDAPELVTGKAPHLEETIGQELHGSNSILAALLPYHWPLQ
jgi:hypothetical protein